MKQILWVMFLLAVWPQAHAGKGAYPELIDQISYDVVEILSKHGMPVRHDREDPWLRTAAKTGSYTLFFYQADEIPLQAKMDVIRYYMQLYEERGRKERFRIRMYREKFEPRLFQPDPFFELTIGGDK